MRPTRQSAPLNQPITLRTAGVPLALQAEGVNLTLWGDEVLECRITLEADLPTLQRIEGEGLLHLSPEAKSPSGAPPFGEGAPIRLECRLDDALLAGLPADPARVASLFAHPGEGAGEALGEQGAWFAMNVKQALGEVYTGYSTRFFEPRVTSVDTEGLPLMTQVVRFLEARRWYYEQRRDTPSVLRLKHSGESGTWTCWATTLEEADLVAFYSEAPFQIPEGSMAAALEYITRANFALSIGNFEVDVDDGALRFRTSVDPGAGDLTALLEPLILANLSLFDHHLPALKAVIFGGMPPRDALA